MAACILNILNANWEGVVDDLRVIGILPPVASVWTNDAGERIKFEAGTVGQWVDLSDPEFKVEPRMCSHSSGTLHACAGCCRSRDCGHSHLCPFVRMLPRMPHALNGCALVCFFPGRRNSGRP